MKKSEILAQSPRHILVYDEDWDYIETHFGRDSPAKLGAGKAIRGIVHSFVRRLKAKAEDARNVAESRPDV